MGGRKQFVKPPWWPFKKFEAKNDENVLGYIFKTSRDTAINFLNIKDIIPMNDIINFHGGQIENGGPTSG